VIQGDVGGERAAGKKSRRSLGRPKVETVRDHYITVRVTAIEHLKVLRKAAASCISVTDYARDRILRGIARKRKSSASLAEEIWIDEVTPLLKAAMQLWHELHKAAINLNQMAHHCNRHQVPPPAGHAELVQQLLALLERLRRP
jgi:hypothetical protein